MPDKLDTLADWFDQDDANKNTFVGGGTRRGVEVQADLRRWAKALREALTALESLGEKEEGT